MTNEQWDKWVLELSREASEDTERLREVIKASPSCGVTEAVARDFLARQYGSIWNSFELARDFEVKGFADPFVVVIRKGDGVRGRLTYQNNPRLYWRFEPAE